MLFSTGIFIFLFLPLVILGYYVLPGRRLKNLFLLLASLAFYAYGEPSFVFVMILSIVVNYFVGLLINLFNKKNKKLSKAFLILGLLFNLSLIFIYKYLMFFLKSINDIFKAHINVPSILLPIGISFFTFQILSYIIDVYREKVDVQKNIFNLGLYISLFPQLIAGPIVRYTTIQDQIMNRKEDIVLFGEGVKRFIYGLAKKVIISNTMAIIVDHAFNSNVSSLSLGLTWLAAIAYALQIYYDFSGYSDMAIGLGKMFGFNFLENFNYPYISKSVSDFWRRWHISLGSWFRDYVYFPMGGSRVSKKRLVFNLFVVWALTGIWHGANYTFIIWGLMYFAILTIEKLTGFEKKTEGKFNILKTIYTLLFVLIGWVIFRADSIGYAMQYIARMFTFTNLVNREFFYYLIENGVIFVLAIVLSTPIYKKAIEKLNSCILEDVILIILLIISVSYIVKGVYNPFIYFNF